MHLAKNGEKAGWRAGYLKSPWSTVPGFAHFICRNHRVGPSNNQVLSKQHLYCQEKILSQSGPRTIEQQDFLTYTDPVSGCRVVPVWP